MKIEPASTSSAKAGCDRFKDDTENSTHSDPQRNNQPAHFQPARKISEMLSKSEFIALAHHLHNGNGPHEFKMAFVQQDGKSVYRKSKTKTAEEAFTWTWDSIIGDPPTPFTVAIHPRNREDESTWAALDIDAHEGPGTTSHERAVWLLRKLAKPIYEKMPDECPPSLAILVEDSGRGFHIWFIAPLRQPVSVWSRLLANVLRAAGLSPAEKGVELFPGKQASGLGHAMRLPGSANVNTWDSNSATYGCSMILFQSGLRQLVDALPPPATIGNNNGSSFSSPFVPKNGTEGTGPKAKPKPLGEHPDTRRLLDTYKIQSPSSRHNALAGLVGDGWFHFSKRQLRVLAKQQYEHADPAPKSSLETHITEFEELYEAIRAKDLDRLSEPEKQIFQRLRGHDLQTAFVIVQSFARYAQANKRWGNDGRFPLSGLDLATRLGVERNAAYRMRKQLIRLQCIRKVQDCKPRVSAEHFIWTPRISRDQP